MFGASLVFQSVRLRLVFESFSQDILGITDRASLAAFRKFHADKGVESHAAGAEERVIVDDSIVQVVNLALIDDLDAFPDIHRDEQVTGETIARSTRDDAQGSIGVYDGASHLIDSAIAPDSYNDVNMVVLGFCRNFRSVSSSFSHSNLVLKKLLVQSRIDQARYASFAARA